MSDDPRHVIPTLRDGTEDPSRPLPANAPIELTANAGWLVEAGSVDLFAQSEHGPRRGRRHLLTSVDPGGLVWPGPGWTVEEGWHLVLIGQPETSVRRLPAAQLEDPAVRVEAAQAVEGLARSITHHHAQVDGPTPTDLDEAAQTFAAAVSSAIGELIADEGDEARRIAARRVESGKRLDTALTGLASVVEQSAPPVTTDDQRRQVGLVLERLGRELGIAFPEYPPETGSLRRTLVEWARAGGARVRVVSLTRGWWRKSGVPMVGYLDAGTRPAALIPSRAGWCMFDPVDSSTTALDEASAARLASTAHVLYPMLPDGPVSARSLIRFGLRRSRGEAARLFGMGLLAGGLALVTPVAVTLVYDAVLPSGELHLLLLVVGFLTLAALTAALATLARNLVLLRLEGIAEATIDPAVIDRLLRIDTAGLRRAQRLGDGSSGDLASRVIGLQRMRSAVTGPVASAVLTLVFSMVSLIFVFAYSVALGTVALASAFVAVVVMAALTRQMLRHQRRAFDVAGRLSGLVLQGIQGIAKIRVAGAEPRFMARWAEEYRAQQSAGYAAGRASNWLASIAGALSAIVLVPVYIVAATALRSSLSTGQFLGVLTALTQFTGAVGAVSISLSQVLLVGPLWARLKPLLDTPSEARGERLPAAPRGRVDVVGVHFRYRAEGPDVLRDLTLRVEPGEFVALTGPSGCGKSTLIRLLIGLDHPERGAVLLDGRDTRQLDMAQVRRSLGVVPQDGQPLPGQVIDTILGAGGGTEEDAWAAAEAAGIADDIAQMPMGMHTILGEGGAAFSGGERQRLLIARALARRPPILLLDEATSALDDRTQAGVSERLGALSATRIVIAHRLSTIRRADRIYVIDQGAVVESGTFEELMRADGAFARLAHRQLAGTGPVSTGGDDRSDTRNRPR